MPGFSMGMLSREDLIELNRIVDKYNVPATKITGAQRIAFLGLEPEKLAELRQECNIGSEPPHKSNRLHYVQACPGSRWCKYATGDSLQLGKKLEKITLKTPLPAKVKVGVSGCRMCCCESWVRDVGLISQKNGWNVIFGGNGAGNPRIGDLIAENLSDDEVVAFIEKLLTFYIDNAKYKTRSARFMERFGIKQLQAGLGITSP